jgi:hypothetical protein
MKSKFLTASLMSLALFAGLGMFQARAQGTQTPNIDNVRQNIDARIQQGMASGQITPFEAQALYRRGRAIENRENQYKSYGNVSPEQREQLRADVAGLSIDVERMMTNRDATAPRLQPGSASDAPGIEQHEFEIGKRIDEGVRSGRLTQREAHRFHMREREIARHKAFLKSDGVLTQPERRQLRNESNALRAEVERLIRSERRISG